MILSWMPDQSEIQSHELSTSSSSVLFYPTSATGPRKLSKRNLPASAYAASHITDIHPPFLASLPEVQPVSDVATLCLDKHPAKFQLGAEDDDCDDDNYNSYPSDDERGLGSSSSLHNSWHG